MSMEADIRRVAAYIISQSGFTHYDDNGDYKPRYLCHLCGSRLEQIKYRQPDIANFRHKSDCIYLVAQDLLTKGSA